MTSKIYTKEEVIEHKTINDCWIIIKNKVYNITDYLTIHPGGKNILLQCAGKDCTEYFNSINHSKKANIELKKYYIGELFNKNTNKCNTLCIIL
jgi:cytochrome b involved in lipid metabolism